MLRDARGPSSPSLSYVTTLPDFPQREGEHGPHRGTSPAPLLGLALAVLRAAGAPGTGLFQAVGSSVNFHPREGSLSLGVAERVQGTPWCDRAVPQGQGALWGPVCWVCPGGRVGLALYHLCSPACCSPLSLTPALSLSLQTCLLQGEDSSSDVPGVLTARASTLAALGFLKLWFSDFCYKSLSLSFLPSSLLGLFSVQILLVSGGELSTARAALDLLQLAPSWR